MKNEAKIIMAIMMSAICSFGYSQKHLDVYLHESEPSETYYYQCGVKLISPLSMNTVSKAVNILVCRFDVPKDSRVAINMAQVSASNDSGVDKEDLKGQIIDILLKKGYKVAAKDFSDYDTLNTPTVDYYINAKLTRHSLRMQVVNVSTGEYEGNETINF